MFGAARDKTGMVPLNAAMIVQKTDELPVPTLQERTMRRIAERAVLQAQEVQAAQFSAVSIRPRRRGPALRQTSVGEFLT
ncbi:hypothetical protein [Paenibacillus humicola]|uniref:hypothetical protein n=1 Tax=Paenibacillus humicola TaxID=3110540 RepID=UPI00237BEED2|nr:hypothetical protein [Paenibacillus humicola]